MPACARASWIGVDIRDVGFTGAYMARRAIMDENYLHEFRAMSRRNAVVHRIWSLTTLGFGDVLPGSTAATVLVMIEVLTGYVMLGGLSSIFATRMGRQAE